MGSAPKPQLQGTNPTGMMTYQGVSPFAAMYADTMNGMSGMLPGSNVQPGGGVPPEVYNPTDPVLMPPVRRPSGRVVPLSSRLAATGVQPSGSSTDGGTTIIPPFIPDIDYVPYWLASQNTGGGSQNTYSPAATPIPAIVPPAGY